MLYVTSNRAEYIFYSPSEVLQARECKERRVNFNKRTAVPAEIEERLVAMLQVRGYKNFGRAIETAEYICDQVLLKYDYLTGYKYRLDIHQLKATYSLDSEEAKLYVERVADILEAFGWNIKTSETKEGVNFIFSPDTKLSPDQTKAAINKRINQLVAGAQLVINNGLLFYKTSFTVQELGLGDAHPKDVNQVIGRLRTLYSEYVLDVSGRPPDYYINFITP